MAKWVNILALIFCFISKVKVGKTDGNETRSGAAIDGWDGDKVRIISIFLEIEKKWLYLHP